uniref:Sorting nexin-14 n=1 Tax=Cacopsylla melanoneura TaxID=428564 RepID=A0A8D8Y386_9HEMI
MEDVTRLPIRSFWQIVSLLREINVEKVWHDGFMRNTIIGVLTVITCIYSVIGFLGSLLLLISFLSGFIVFHKVFFIYNVTVPDLTKLVSQNWSTSCTEEQHKRRQLIRQNTSDPGCKVCADINCCREQSPTHSTKPWEDLTIPFNVNQALETLLTKLLDKYISSWYVNICPENDPNSSHFQTELKLTIRHAASILIHRVQKLDLTNFLLYRVLPLAAKHIHTVENNSRQIKPKWHRALNNRNTELDYLRCLSRQLLPILLPPACYNCRTFYLLNQELVSGWLLLPLSDAVSNPTVLNTFLLYLLDSKSGTENKDKEDQVGEKKIVSPLHDAGDEESEDTSVEAAAHGSNPISNEEDSSPTQSEHVQLLSTFVPRCESKSDLWHPNLEAILKDQSLLFAFMQYLKSQADINVLQFCLDVEEFNSRMLAPDLSPDDLDILYKDAWDIYSIYFSAHSPDCIAFDPKLAQELRKILSKDVSKLRTSPPLFKAYEAAYSRLERLHVSNFHKSEEFFNHLCGPKISSSNTTSGLSSPESLDSPLKRKKSPDGPVAKLSNRLQKITGVLKPNVVLEGQKDVADSILPEVEVELAETVKESDSEERDLSKWKVSVFNSRVKSNPNFTVKVVRTDLPPHDPDAEWSVARKIQDFYTLETKLTEFHGNFSDVQLPAKKLLVPCPDDSRVYEIYLRTILSKPGLKGSDLLFAFLKAPTFEVEQFALSRLFKKSVPGITLKKERGQHLDLFIRNFLDSTKTKASKIEWKDISEELKPRHVVNMRSKVFGNNLDIPPQGETIDNIGLQYSTTMETRVLDGPAKCLLFIGIKSYKLARSIVRLIFALLTLFKSTLDSLIYMFVTKTLNTSLSSDNIAYLVYCLDWSLFENTVSVDPKQMKDSVEAKIGQSSALLRPLLNKCFVTLQDPLLNKQLFYQIFEEVLAEIFPELLHPISTSSISSQPSDTGN